VRVGVFSGPLIIGFLKLFQPLSAGQSYLQCIHPRPLSSSWHLPNRDRERDCQAIAPPLSDLDLISALFCDILNHLKTLSSADRCPMTANVSAERRAEARSPADRYYSVQFTVAGLRSHYQFKTWNISQKGLCILVKEGSAVLEYLHAGDVLEMTYYANDPLGTQETLKTRIQHITKNETGRFQGHYLVGLSIE
jgi:hypothetical protein